MKIIIDRLKKNYVGFWRTYRWMIVVFIIALLCDAGSTIWFMLKDDPDIEEVNVSIAMVSDIFGPIVGPLIGALGKFCAAIFVAVYWRRAAFYLFMTGSILFFWAGWYNVWGVNMYSPRLLVWLGKFQPMRIIESLLK